MSNAAATIGLTYRSTDIQQPFNGAAAMFLEIVRGLSEPPSVRGVDLVVPGRDGRIQGSRRRDMVTVELEGVVLGESGALELSTFRAKATAFRALFDPTISGALVATVEDGTTRTLTQARTTSVLWDQLGAGIAWVNVAMESPEGDWS